MRLATSGSSGASRRVVRTTASWVSSFNPVAALSGLDAASRMWVPGPLSATMNLFAAVHAHRLGAALVGSPAEATHAQLTPAALGRLLDDGTPVAGLTLVVAGDRLGRALHDRAVAAGAVVHHYYGAAELSFVAWGPHADALRPFPGADVEVRDGEVWVRSPYLSLGYDGPPGPLRRDADGFATVGDRGRLEDGRLVVLGRPDAVTTGGETVLVADVEAALRELDAGELAVVGLPHPQVGEVVAAVVTRPRDGLVADARRLLPGPGRPRRWFALDRLPLTPAGKLDRAALVSLLTSPDGPARPLV